MPAPQAHRPGRLLRGPERKGAVPAPQPCPNCRTVCPYTDAHCFKPLSTGIILQQQIDNRDKEDSHLDPETSLPRQGTTSEPCAVTETNLSGPFLPFFSVKKKKKGTFSWDGHIPGASDKADPPLLTSHHNKPEISPRVLGMTKVPTFGTVISSGMSTRPKRGPRESS